MAIRVLAADCVGCGQCISLCPWDALAPDDDLVAVLDEPKCTDCKACIYICPVDAIVSVERLEWSVA